jgi:hypothetical protein
MSKASFYKFQFYRADASIVHVGRRNAVSSGESICHSNIGYAFNAHGVVQTPVISQNAAVAMGGVLAETDVYDYIKVAETAAQQLDRLYNRALRIVCSSALWVFGAGRERNPKKNDGFESFSYKRRQEGNELG